MSRVSNKSVIKKGKLIDNYLVNFPQYLDRKGNTLYKLVIGCDDVTTFIINVSNNTEISLSDIVTDIDDDTKVDWGVSSGYTQDLTNIYTTSGQYKISIWGKQQLQLSNNFKPFLTKIEMINKNITNLNSTFKDCKNLIQLPNEILGDHISNCDSTFFGCDKLSCIPEQFSLPKYCTSFNNMFENTNLNEFQNKNFALPPLTKSCSRMFKNTKIVTVPKHFFDYCLNQIQCIDQCFCDCIYLRNIQSVNPINMINLKSLQGLFKNCLNITKTNKDFNITSNITSIKQLFFGCRWLCSVGKLVCHNNLINLSDAFNECRNLKLDIKNFLNVTFKDGTNLYRTFCNCVQLGGMVPVWNLWLSYTNFSNHTDTFLECTKFRNHNIIPSNWGGVEHQEITSGRYFKGQNHYGYFQINIPSSKAPCYYLLPIFKWKNEIHTNQNMAKYHFQINYGDDNVWHKVHITNKMYDFWIKDENSIFNGYPQTVNILFNNVYDNIQVIENLYENYKLVELKTIQQQDISYKKLITESIYGNLFQNVVHRYQKPGNYVITIRGSVDSLYVHQQDTITNSLLTKIYSINNLGLKTFNHTFCNALNLQHIQNQPIPTSIINTSYMFYLNKNKTNNISYVPQEFKITSQITDTSYMFYNFFSYSPIHLTGYVSKNLLPTFNTSGTNIQRMFANCRQLYGDLTGNVISNFINNSNITNKTGCFENNNQMQGYPSIPPQKGGGSGGGTTPEQKEKPKPEIINPEKWEEVIETWDKIYKS